MRPSRSTRRLQLEVLEGRQLMAGVVNVAVRGGSLFVTGDGAANSVAIGSGDNPGEVQIVADTNDGTKLSVNGQLVDAATLGGFSYSVIIQLMEGDDRVAVTNLSIRNELVIQTFGGNDLVYVGDLGDIAGDLDLPYDFAGPVSVGGTINIDTGSGGDAVGIVSVAIGNHLIMNTGDGDDTIGITSANIGHEVRITTGNGADQLYLGNPPLEEAEEEWTEAEGEYDEWECNELLGPVAIGGSTVIYMQGGDDYVNMVDVSMGGSLILDVGDGSNHVTMYSNSDYSEYDSIVRQSMASSPSIWIGDNFFLYLGTGYDIVEIYPEYYEGSSSIAPVLQVGYSMQITDLGGVAYMELDSVRASRLDIRALGTGESDIYLYNAYLDWLTVYTYSGIDEVAVIDSHVNNSVIIDTGEQSDDVYLYGLYARDLRVFLGGGDDFLSIEDTHIVNDVLAYGLGGIDTFANNGNNTWRRLTKLLFEK